MSKKVFYAFLVLIVLLVIFNIKLHKLDNALTEACVEDYTSYLENKTCPCFVNGQLGFDRDIMPEWLMSPYNYSQGINISVK